MKTLTRRKQQRNTDRLLSGVERSIMKQVRRLKKQELVLKRKQARAIKHLEREAYGWCSQGW